MYTIWSDNYLGRAGPVHGLSDFGSGPSWTRHQKSDP